MSKIGIDARLWNETGVGRYIRNLVSQLAIIDKKNEYILFLRKKEFDTLPLPGENFQKQLADFHWHTVEEQFKFPLVLEKEHLDLVHFPYFSLPIFYRGAYVVTIHDLILHHFPTGKASTRSLPVYYGKLFLYKLLIEQAASSAKKIIAVSKATKNEIIDHLRVPEEKVIVTYEGIDEIFTAKKTPTKPLITQPYFLYVGNAYPHKNLERLISAFVEFRSRSLNNAILVLVGRNDYFYQHLRDKVINKEIDKYIVIKNDVSDSNLKNLYAHAIAVIVPSLMEGFGLPALEAMSQGCLVLASDIPSIREICRESVIYVNPFDERAIAEKLDFIYTQRTKFSEEKKHAKIRAKAFSWKKMAEETKRVYESCISI